MRDFLWTNVIHTHAYGCVYGQDYDFVQSLLNLPIIQHLLSFLSRKYSWTRRRWSPSSPSSSSSLLSTPSARENIFPEGSRAHCSCTSFHSRCLRHTFTKLNWFSRTTRVQIHAGSYIGVFNGKCRSSRFDVYTRCLIIIA